MKEVIPSKKYSDGDTETKLQRQKIKKKHVFETSTVIDGNVAA